ncbi:MAG: hypothetical protein R3F34_09115 [Planctomycetota bacterium]
MRAQRFGTRTRARRAPRVAIAEYGDARLAIAVVRRLDDGSFEFLALLPDTEYRVVGSDVRFRTGASGSVTPVGG